MKKIALVVLMLALAAGVNAQSIAPTFGYTGAGGGTTFAGGAITSPLLIPDGTVALPGLAGSNYTNWGLYFTAGPILNLSAGNSRAMFWTGSLMGFNKTYQLCWYTAAFAAQETCLTDSASAVNDTLELRRTGANPQTFNIYNTYTDVNNWEVGRLYWTLNEYRMESAKLGSGSLRDIRIKPASGYLLLDTLHRVNSTPLALTAGTMNSGVNGMSDYLWATTWSNAMVAALPSTAGDIKAVTLPAGTVVRNAYVAITGQAAGPATVTVSCGRTGATYTDYIVASDAKAAANTVYGAVSGDRGTNLTGYDLPSYTATTDIYCHFISSGANLSTVTGSSGILYLITTSIAVF